MFGYHLWLAAKSLQRTPAMSALMVLAFSVGIGASVTTLTVLRLLTGDPEPGRSDVLYVPQIEPRSSNSEKGDGEPPTQLTYIDAMALLQAGKADRQAVMVGGDMTLVPEDPAQPARRIFARYTSAEFFALFDVPFRSGRGWTSDEEENRDRVVVLSKSLNDRLFNGADSSGRTIVLSGKVFRIIGVLRHWSPTPHFYDLDSSHFASSEDVYLPFTTALDAGFPAAASIRCWGTTNFDVASLKQAPCTWLQFWVELDTPAKVAAYRRFLNDYSDAQRAAGRFQRPNAVRLRSLPEWLTFRDVVPTDVRLQAWIAAGFLFVCLVNSIGLMLARFLRRSGEISIRRALGAPRRLIFLQCLSEAALIGVAGAIGGLFVAALGLAAIRQQPDPYAKLAQLNPQMVLIAVALAVLASLLAGAFPALRACRLAPGLQLKSF